MTIHHAILRKAEKLGVVMTEDKETDTFTAHWPKHNIYAKGVGGFGKAAMLQMEAIQTLQTKIGDEFRIKNDGDDLFNIRVYNHDLSRTLDREPMLPVDALLVYEQRTGEWPTTTVPEDGAQAFAEGWTAADNPFRNDEDGEVEEDPRADEWDDAFDVAADDAENVEDEEPSGSVVKPEYRARYAEAGHPNHCGDWLAETLNNLFLGKSKTDVEGFEQLCGVNEVDLSKYKHEGNGWQGRLRMTGRNLLARRIYIQQGVMLIPAGIHPEGLDRLNAPAEWMATQRFKMPKAEANKKEPVATLVVDNTAVADQQAEDAIEQANDIATDPDLQAPNTDGREPEVPSVQDQLAKHKASKRKSRK